MFNKTDLNYRGMLQVTMILNALFVMRDCNSAVVSHTKKPVMRSFIVFLLLVWMCCGTNSVCPKYSPVQAHVLCLKT